MNWLLVAICLGSLSLAFGKGCSTSFQFRAVCHHYLYGESCQPGFEHLCQPTKTTYNNPICPISICLEESITVKTTATSEESTVSVTRSLSSTSTMEEPTISVTTSLSPSAVPHESTISVTTSVTTTVTPSGQNLGQGAFDDSTVSVSTSVTPSFMTTSDSLHDSNVTMTSSTASTSFATTIMIRTNRLLETIESSNGTEKFLEFETDPALNVTEQLRELSEEATLNVAEQLNDRSEETRTPNVTLDVIASNVTLATEHLFVESDQNEVQIPNTHIDQPGHDFKDEPGQDVNTTSLEQSSQDSDQQMNRTHIDELEQDLNPPSLELSRNDSVSFQADDVTTTAPFSFHQNWTFQDIGSQPFSTPEVREEETQETVGTLEPPHHDMPVADVTNEDLPAPVTNEALPAPESLNEDDWFKTHHSRALHRLDSNLRDVIECRDGRNCSTVVEFLEECPIYFSDDDHPDCDLPCDLEKCKMEIHFGMNCPVYICTLPTSSTTSPTTTTTASPPIPPSHPISPAMYGSSVAFTLIFAAAVVVLLVKLWRRPAHRTPIIRPRPSGFANPLFRDRDPEENDPLMAALAFAPRRNTNYGIQGFDAAQNRMVEASDPATFELEPSAPPPSYAAAILERDIELGDSRSETVSPTPSGPRENPFTGLVSAFDKLFKRNKPETEDPLSDLAEHDGITSADL